MKEKIKAIYDNGGETFDRITVYYGKRNPVNKLYDCLCLSEKPFSLLGFCQHSTGMLGKHNGKKIKIEDLPEDCIKAIKQNELI